MAMEEWMRVRDGSGGVVYDGAVCCNFKSRLEMSKEPHLPILSKIGFIRGFRSLFCSGNDDGLKDF